LHLRADRSDSEVHRSIWIVYCRELQYSAKLKRVGAPDGMLRHSPPFQSWATSARIPLFALCDSHLVPMLNELKMDHRNISRAVNSLEYGMVKPLMLMLVGSAADRPVRR
jgi:hypothetical protein